MIGGGGGGGGGGGRGASVHKHYVAVKKDVWWPSPVWDAEIQILNT